MWPPSPTATATRTPPPWSTTGSPRSARCCATTGTAAGSARWTSREYPSTTARPATTTRSYCSPPPAPRAPDGPARTCCSPTCWPSCGTGSGTTTPARSANRGTADWTVTEDYRGANSSMHMVEAFLAAAAATGDASWADRALRIATTSCTVRRPARLAAARALHHRLDAAARLQPGPARRPVPAVRLHHRALAGMGPAAAGVGGGPAAATPLAARRRPRPVRRRRASRLGGRRRGRLRLHDRLGRPAGGALPDALGSRRGRSVRRSPCTAAPATRSTPTGTGSSGRTPAAT